VKEGDFINIKVTMKSGRVFQFEVSTNENHDKFMNTIFKGKSVRFGKMILNTNEIETIEIE
jgi:hypothetical protein